MLFKRQGQFFKYAYKEALGEQKIEKTLVEQPRQEFETQYNKKKTLLNFEIFEISSLRTPVSQSYLKLFQQKVCKQGATLTK